MGWDGVGWMDGWIDGTGWMYEMDGMDGLDGWVDSGSGSGSGSGGCGGWMGGGRVGRVNLKPVTLKYLTNAVFLHPRAH